VIGAGQASLPAGASRGTPTAPGAAGVPRFWAAHRAAVLSIAVVAAAALVDLGHLHRFEWGDSIVPVLVSLQRWTPFYWEQERYGMLVPLLAAPIRDPLWNLLLQRLLLTAAGLGAVVLVARHVLAGRDWPLAGALAVAGLLAAAPPTWLFEYCFDQPYGLSLALAAGGLAVAEPGPGGRGRWPRLALGAVLVVLGHWVNAATGILLVALAAARAVVDRLEGAPPRAVRERFVRDVGLLVLGLAAGQALMRLAPPSAGPFRVDPSPLPIAALPGAWARLLGNAWRESGRWPAVLAATAGAGVALLALRPARAHLPAAVGRAAALVAAAVAWALFAGSLRWVQSNFSHWRYLAPSAVLVQLAAASLLGEALARLRRTARPAALAALGLVPVAALASGAPSLARARADLDAATGRLTPDLLAAGCDVVAGSYWTVWPAVWHATLARHARGDDRPIHGVAHRAGPTLPAWRGRPGVVVCCAAGEEPHAQRWLRELGLAPMRAAHRVGTVVVLEPDPAAGAPPGEPPIEWPPRWWWGTRPAPPGAPTWPGDDP
jgi:hypothetical protein